MRIRLLNGDFTVCKAWDASVAPLTAEYCFVAKTNGEVSIVCETAFAPEETMAREDGWRAMGVCGTLDFGLTGVLAGMTGALARAGIPVFAVSSYDTDYLLVKAERLTAATDALAAAGYPVNPDVYERCPEYAHGAVALRKTEQADAQALLSCYADSAMFVNSDNCHGDDFRYQTLERMREAIAFWLDSYGRREFVRWTVLTEGEAVGTVEMFRRSEKGPLDRCGLLRIDLRPDREKQALIEDILQIAQDHFYDDFDVPGILTKGFPESGERIAALTSMGYDPLRDGPMGLPDYFGRMLIDC